MNETSYVERTNLQEYPSRRAQRSIARSAFCSATGNSSTHVERAGPRGTGLTECCAKGMASHVVSTTGRACLTEAKRALAEKDAAPLLRLYDWNGVPRDARRSSTQAAKELVQRKIESILIQSKGIGGNMGYIEDGRLFTPNGTVVAHLIFKCNDGSAAVDLPLGMKNEKVVLLGFGPKDAQ